MIADTTANTSTGAVARLALAFVRMVRNRRALRDLDAARLDDCGISREALEHAIDWRFWRRLDAAPAQAGMPAAALAQADMLAAAPAPAQAGMPTAAPARIAVTAPDGTRTKPSINRRALRLMQTLPTAQ